jgi:predicted transcriptional regulator
LKILWAAGTNGHDQTLSGMGAVLGRAARATQRDDAEAFADAELALRAMADLTERHFRVLAVIAKSEVLGTARSENYSQFTPKHVAAQTGMGEEIAHQCLLNLAAAGLTVQQQVMGGTAYPITELGRAVLDAASEVGDD